MRVNVLEVPNKPHAHAGQVLDLPEAEAKDMIRRGAATAAPDEPPAELPGEPEPDPDPELAKAPAAAQTVAAPKSRATTKKSKKG